MRLGTSEAERVSNSVGVGAEGEQEAVDGVKVGSEGVLRVKPEPVRVRVEAESVAV